MKRIIVTGGSGFVGTNLVQHFVDSGSEVLNVDIVPPRNPAHGEYWSKVDILDQDRLQKVFSEFLPDMVFHMAARTDLNGRAIQDYRSNTDGVRNVIEAASGLPNLKRVIFASSMLVCRLGYRPTDDADYNPTTAYGLSKVEGERLVRTYANGRFSWAIVRPTSLWGPWFGVPYRNFFDAVRAGWYVHPKGVKVHRSYGFILNSIYQLNCLATADSDKVDGKTFYLADYDPIELMSWAEYIRREFNVSQIREVPMWLLEIAARMGDILKLAGMKTPPLTTFRLNNLVTEAIHNLEPLKQVCGPTPYGVEQGVKITIDWMQNRG
jgi:nucleoside-diphosphate-sugar epimerase